MGISYARSTESVSCFTGGSRLNRNGPVSKSSIGFRQITDFSSPRNESGGGGHWSDIEAEFAVPDLNLPDCRKHGLQRRLPAVGTSAADGRLNGSAIRLTELFFSLSLSLSPKPWLRSSNGGPGDVTHRGSQRGKKRKIPLWESLS